MRFVSGTTAKVVWAREAVTTTDIPIYPWITSIISLSGGLEWTNLLASRQCFFFFLLLLFDSFVCLMASLKVYKRNSMENHLLSTYTFSSLDGFAYLVIHYPFTVLFFIFKDATRVLHFRATRYWNGLSGVYSLLHGRLLGRVTGAAPGFPHHSRSSS
jgi:hypothetical protein